MISLFDSASVCPLPGFSRTDTPACPTQQTDPLPIVFCCPHARFDGIDLRHSAASTPYATSTWSRACFCDTLSVHAKMWNRRSQVSYNDTLAKYDRNDGSSGKSDKQAHQSMDHRHRGDAEHVHGGTGHDGGQCFSAT